MYNRLPINGVYTCQNWISVPNITAGTLVPSSVNGDIAIQWEWSNFDPSQNPNPLTDYDKTLHNWLCPRDEHVIQNLCLAKYVKYKASLFYLYFFPDSEVTEVTRAWNFMNDGSKHALWRKGSAFWGSTRWPTTFWGSNSPKTVKNGLL